MFQVANLAIVGRLESDVDYIAATVAIRLTYHNRTYHQ